MSDTPRTDAEYNFKKSMSENPCVPNEHAEWMTSLCRELERERNALRAAIKNWLKVKGRHNSQIAAARLAELVGEPFEYPEGKSK